MYPCESSCDRWRSSAAVLEVRGGAILRSNERDRERDAGLVLTEPFLGRPKVSS